MLNVQIIGLGKLVQNLAHALSPHVQTLYLYSRTLKKLSLPNAFWVQDLSLRSDTVLTCITTHDAGIAHVVNTLKKSPTYMPQHIIHCSGALSSDILNPLKKQGHFTASLHPYRSFSLPASPQALQGCHVFFEGCQCSQQYLMPLLKACGAILHPIEKKQKTQYHLAAVFASNYMVTLAKIAYNMCHESAALLDLMEKTLVNLKSAPDFEQAFTGPIVRGDLHTIKTHLNQLTTPFEKKLYKTLALATLKTMPQDMALKKSLQVLLHTMLNL